MGGRRKASRAKLILLQWQNAAQIVRGRPNLSSDLDGLVLVHNNCVPHWFLRNAKLYSLHTP